MEDINEKKEQKNSVIIYYDDVEILNRLSPESFKAVINAVVLFSKTGEVTELEDIAADMSLKFILQKVARDRQKYDKTCQSRAEAGKRGGAPRGNQNAAKARTSDDTDGSDVVTSDDQKQPKQAKQAKQANGCFAKNENNLKTTKTSKTSQCECECECECDNDSECECDIEREKPFPLTGKWGKETPTSGVRTHTQNEQGKEPLGTGDKPEVSAPPKGSGSGDRDDHSARDKPEKRAYGEFVYLTEQEHAQLVKQYGADGARRLCEILDNYKGQSKKNRRRYDSDYRAILNWVVLRYEEESRKGAMKPDTKPPNFDIGEYERSARPRVV